MARKLSVVLIDDHHADSFETINLIDEFARIEVVGGLEDAIELLYELKKERNAVVDIVLCDLNMQDDFTNLEFNIQLPCRMSNENYPIESDIFPVEPRFTVDSLGNAKFGIDGEGNDETYDALNFRPIGPLLALPFTHYFRDGGVVRPISIYWRDPRLIVRGDVHNSSALGALNGYVHAALTLIWAATESAKYNRTRDSSSPLNMFGKRFSNLLSQARGATPSNIILEQFYEAVIERRQQILSNALSVHGLEGISLERIESGGEVTVWPQRGPIECFNLRSLFSDYCREFQLSKNRNEASGRDRMSSLRAKLSNEIASISKLDVQKLGKFCIAFFEATPEVGEIRFQSCYHKALAAIEDPGDATTPYVTTSNELPPHLRRYLLLFAQLRILSAGEYRPQRRKPKGTNYTIAGGDGQAATRSKGLKDVLCETLGILGDRSNIDHLLEDFMHPGRSSAAKRTENRETEPFATAFRVAPGLTGWQPYNLVYPQRSRAPDGQWVDVEASQWRWSAMDRSLAKIAWMAWADDGVPLPRHLGDD